MVSYKFDSLESVVDPWIAKLWDVLPTVLQRNSQNLSSAPVEELTEKVQEVKIEDDPYSMRGRKQGIPPAVEPYLDLPNTLIKKEEKPKLILGHALQIDRSGLQAGTQLTGFPRVPASTAKLNKLGTTRSAKDTPSIDFVTTPSPVLKAPITAVRCLTTEDALKRTLHVELDVKDQLEFEPGDAFGVIAPNDESLVEAVIERLGFSTAEGYETLYEVAGESLPTHLQKASSVTLGDLFRYAVDLTTPPRKALLRMLADYTSDPQEKTTLMYLCSKQGASQFNAIRDQMPTFLDILVTFPSCKPPVERLLDCLPAHMPRYYSIANSPLKSPSKIHFAFNVVNYTTSFNVPRKGVATPWLDKLTGMVPARQQKVESIELDGSIQVPVFKKTNANAFVLPTDTKRPLVLIGPGTGIAPFIGFLEHRQQQKKIRKMMGGVGAHPSRDIDRDFGSIWVYYGFRERAKDYLFNQELEEFVQDGTVANLRLAISRDNPERKEYVQDLIRADAEALYDLIVKQDAAIYVCGDAKGMAKGVQDALVEIICQYQQVDAVAANKLLIEWMGSRKYLRDLVSITTGRQQRM